MINSDVPGPALLSSLTDNNSAQPPANQQSSFSQLDIFSSTPASSSTTPQLQVNQQSIYQPPPPAKDPFAALGAANISMTPSPQPSLQSAPPPKPANDDDEWNFASSLPPETPQGKLSHDFRFAAGDVDVFLAARRANQGPAIDLAFDFKNKTHIPIEEFHFQLAVTKVCNLYPSRPTLVL